METKVTNEQLRAFAKFIESNEPVFQEVIKRTHMKLFEQFITADDSKRKEIGNIINASALFQSEINAILAEAITNPNG